ncbi:hypothetical protein [Enterococcus sp. LJL51]|uniref:hypothetical protein n=1 Tax=Enterococcus sp. LJL51 TaxID=3416656 RepID=UPI003CF4810B
MERHRIFSSLAFMLVVTFFYPPTAVTFSSSLAPIISGTSVIINQGAVTVSVKEALQVAGTIAIAGFASQGGNSSIILIITKRD